MNVNVYKIDAKPIIMFAVKSGLTASWDHTYAFAQALGRHPYLEPHPIHPALKSLEKLQVSIHMCDSNVLFKVNPMQSGVVDISLYAPEIVSSDTMQQISEALYSVLRELL